MPKVFLEIEEVDEMDPRQSLKPRTPITLNESDPSAKIAITQCNYIVVLTQSGGCDYTIGCGVKVKSLHATTIEAAMEEVEHLIESNYGSGPEHRIDDATIYETTGKFRVDTQAIYAGIAARAKAEQEEEQEEEERETLARLTKKYGRPS